LYEPMALFDVGLQLSFLATFGVVHVAPLARRWLSGVPRFLSVTMGASLGSQIAVAPALAYYFHQISLVGLLANLIVVPVAALLLAGGVGATVFAFILPSAGALVGVPLAGLVRSMVWVVAKVAQWPYASAQNFPWSVEATLAVYGGMVALGAAAVYWDRVKRWRWRRALVTGMAVAALVLGWRAAMRRPEMELTALQVGSGYAGVLRDHRGRAYLLDAGGYSAGGSDAAQRIVLPFLLREWVRRLEAVVVTSADFEHTSCLGTVLEEMPVGAITAAVDLQAGSPSAQRAAHVALRRGVPVLPSERAGSVLIERGAGEEFAALVVVREVALLWCPHTSVPASLLDSLGDAKQVVVFAPLTATDASAVMQLQRERRLAALVLLGRGRTVSAQLTEVAREAGASVLRTDTDGAVRVQVRGNRLSVRTFE